MIFDSLDKLEYYEPFMPVLKTVRELLAAERMHEKEPGSYTTQTPGCRYNIAQYQTCTESKLFEIHQKEADLQIMLSGTERMEAALRGTAEKAGPYDSVKDLAMVEAATCASVIAEPDYFVLFLPGEPHAPGLAAGTASRVKKIVFKLTL